MSTLPEKELIASVERYCRHVREFAHFAVAGAEGNMLRAKFRQVKAEHERYLALKFDCQRLLPNYESIATTRARFKMAHENMREMEDELQEIGILLRVEAVGVPIEGGIRYFTPSTQRNLDPLLFLLFIFGFLLSVYLIVKS